MDYLAAWLLTQFSKTEGAGLKPAQTPTWALWETVSNRHAGHSDETEEVSFPPKMHGKHFGSCKSALYMPTQGNLVTKPFRCLITILDS